tara:strand:+ start:801 stop:1259 length:459 start_codon:yes stop_codon:yes gene_type:complete
MKSFFIYFMMSWVLVFAVVVEAYSSELVHNFKSPSFSGQGYSAHVMTIENQEFSRKKAIDDKRAADERQAQRDLANTNLSKFMKNVESRIYAQLSKQLVDSMFGEESGESGTVTFEGTTISYVKDTENVALTILDANGSETIITVPIGDFTF